MELVATHRAADTTQTDEAALVRRAAQSPDAFARLYQFHHHAIYTYLCRRTGNPHAAEDLAAETFLTAMRKIGAYRPTGAPFRVWLYRIATNKANHWARSRRREPARATLDTHTAPPAVDSNQPDDTHAALLALPVKHQTVLTLHHIEGLSVEEVAATIGRSQGAVKSRLFRARAALREEIQRRRRAHA